MPCFAWQWLKGWVQIGMLPCLRAQRQAASHVRQANPAYNGHCFLLSARCLLTTRTGPRSYAMFHGWLSPKELRQVFKMDVKPHAFGCAKIGGFPPQSNVCWPPSTQQHIQVCKCQANARGDQAAPLKRCTVLMTARGQAVAAAVRPFCHQLGIPCQRQPSCNDLASSPAGQQGDHCTLQQLLLHSCVSSPRRRETCQQRPRSQRVKGSRQSWP